MSNNRLSKVELKINTLRVKLSTDNVKEDSGFQSFTPSQLKSFLQNHFQKEGVSTDPLDQLEKDEISGKVLLTMSEADLQMVMPTASFGSRRIIMTLINEHDRSQSTISHLQHVRDFDIEVQHGDFYSQGGCVDVDIQIRGKRTTRIKNFHSLYNQTQQQIYDYSAVEVVLFAAACINDRRNGTLYLGISPEETHHHKAGEVVGICVSKEEFQRKVDALLKGAFYEHHKTAIQCTIRPARFVPIHVHRNKVGADENIKEKFVIEYDIVPNSDVLQDHTMKIKLKEIPHLYKKDRMTDGLLKFSDVGKPRLLKETELYSYETEKGKIFSQRKIEEAIKSKLPQQNLYQALQKLLTGGNTVIEDNIFIVLGPLNETEGDRDSILPHMSFLKHMHPEAVYDFDGAGSSDGIYHFLDDDENLVTRVLTVDDFNPKQNGRDKINELASTLRKEKHVCWIFCNGYEEIQMQCLTCTDWNKRKRNAFTEILKAFLDIVHNDNITVLFCLFSSNYEVMLEASEEIVLKLPNQWILLAESEKVASMWHTTMLQRKKIDKSDIEERSVIGMTWQQVDRCINALCNTEDVINVELPQSNGTFVSVSEKTIDGWSDIEVVSAADTKYEDKNDENHELQKRKLEEEFYKGAQVKWLNFRNPDQVCVRCVHEELKKNVETALRTERKEEEVKTMPVYLNHQPGAGGTTSARQVLWCLRKDYRCCVTKDITEQTSDQLKDVYLYEDRNPKPLLVLLDNVDEEKLEVLRAGLDRVTHDLQTEMQGELSLFSVLLICVRCTALKPAKRRQTMTFLRQELQVTELEWFRRKSEDLESRFSKDKAGNVNPKFLISFNILKENFNPEYITKVVKEFTDEISDEREQRILKYVSLLNNHDIYFTAIPIACLNKILQNTNTASKHYKNEINWETNVSQSLKVLLESPSQKKRQIPKTIRVFHKLIADEALKRMKILSDQPESEIMKELLTSVFDYIDRDSKEMQRIVKNVIRKRPYTKDDPRKKELFSSLILSITRNEGGEQAIELWKSLFDLDQDPFTAQQIARSYLEMKNYREAEGYAKYSTEKLPKNSCMWDTYGQVYKNQLFDKSDSERSQISHSGFSSEDIDELIDLFQRSVYYFRKVQSVNQEEMNNCPGKYNFAGYFNELRCILLILTCLENCPLFDSNEKLHDCLVKETSAQFSHSLNEKQKKCIKGLYSSAKQTMQKLEEEILQRKSKCSMDSGDASDQECFFNQYSFLKKSLHEYFGETTNDVQDQSMSEEEQCEYRYRRARTLGATSLQSLLELANTEGCDGKVSQLYDLLLPNVNSKFCRFEYLKTMLDIVVILSMKEQLSLKHFPSVLDFSFQLYSAGDDKVNLSLEKYLYFIIFHFPTEERKQYDIRSPFDLNNAIVSWKSAYDKKYYKNNNVKKETAHRKETTLFFLGKGYPLHDLVYQDQLTDIMDSSSGAQKWYDPKVHQFLRCLSGILLEGGHTIKYYFKTSDGNRQHLSIQTCIRVAQRNWWQKRVYFFLGFSYSGPKAYGIRDKMPCDADGSKVRPDWKKNSQTKLKYMTTVEEKSLAELKVREKLLSDKIKTSKGKHRERLTAKLDKINNKITELLRGE